MFENVKFTAGGFYRAGRAAIPTRFTVVDNGTRVRATSQDGRLTFDIATFPAGNRRPNLADAKKWFHAWQGSL